jgi:hypothetical protein
MKTRVYSDLKTLKKLGKFMFYYTTNDQLVEFPIILLFSALTIRGNASNKL